MKATSYGLILLSLFFAANASAGEQDAGGTATDKGGTTAICGLIAWRYFPTTFIKLEGQDQETKLVDKRGAPYGRLALGQNLLCNRLYQMRFEPPDDAYSFVAAGDRMLKITAYGYDGQEGKTLNPVPPILLALPVPSTPFYFRHGYAPAGVHYPQVQSMDEFNAATSTVWYLKPAEKGASGPYAKSNLYVKFYGGCLMVLEDSTVKLTVSIIEPKDGETASGIIIARASITERMGIMGVEFRIDGAATGYDKLEYGVNFHLAPARVLIDTRMLTDGPHEIAAGALVSRGERVESNKVTFKVKNTAPPIPR